VIDVRKPAVRFCAPAESLEAETVIDISMKPDAGVGQLKNWSDEEARSHRFTAAWPRLRCCMEPVRPGSGKTRTCKWR
jgi:hypothetical protein